MSSAKLNLIARKLARQEQIPVAPASDDLAVAIERLVQERVEAELARQPAKPPAHVQRLLDQQFHKPPMPTDFKQIPSVPTTPAPKAMEFQFQRDELGRINMVDVGSMQFRVQRNETGQIVRLVPADIAPMPPTLPALAARGDKPNKGT